MTDNDEQHDREREAEWRWGNTDSWKESQRKTARYTPADWQRLKDEAKQLLDAIVALMRTGASPESEKAMALAELYREYNSKWFYETSHEMHAMLAEGYVSDERFKKTYEDIAAGLADFVSRSIIANAHRAGANLEIDDALANVRASMGFEGSANVATGLVATGLVPGQREESKHQRQRHDKKRKK